MSSLSAAGRYARTLPHLKPWQVAGRLVAQAKRALKLYGLPEVPEAVHGRFEPRVRPPHHEPWNTRHQLLAGHYCFLNERSSLGATPNWAAENMPLLWRFNLHYFNYLHLLADDEQVALCSSWIDSNAPGSVGWHPYPTSLRIVNWCRAGLQVPDVQRSLYQQAGFLFRNLETYVYGNHLLENARALVHAGRFFAGQGEADRWFAKGLQILREQTSEQVLPDGGHFERSPMYHAIMLEGYVDVLNLLPEGHEDRAWLTEVVHRMMGFLRATTHPDGELALFNDSTQEIALRPDVLLAYAEAVAGPGAPAASAYPDTGYYVYQDDDLYLIVDAGPAGPDYLMAHAHADVFSFEISIGGKQFITDTGVYEYPAGEMRSYARSTRAHNTVVIDGRDQIECWGSFRVGRRADPENVRWVNQPPGCTFYGEFRGYARSIGDALTHARTISVDARERSVRIEDVVQGSGAHAVETRLHLHPEVAVLADRHVRLSRDSIDCILEPDGGDLRWQDGWYGPRFGVRIDRPIATVKRAGILPAKVAFTLRY